MNIADVLHKSADWKTFKEQITSLQERQKGDCFESLTKYFLQLHPTYLSQLQNVWFLKEVPLDVRQYLNLPGSDEGIDLIAQTIDNDYWAVQCKYKDDENHSLGRDELSTFTDLAFVICKNIQFGLVCTTADRFSHKLELYGNRLGFCSGEVWRGLDKEFFLQVHEKLDNKPFLPEPLKPLKHQERAIENACQHFIEEGNSRGKLISPCGSGKSLAGYWIAEKLGGNKILIAVPSLSLIRQTLAVWIRECVANKRQFNWIVVCSDETVKESNNDDIAVIVQDLGILVHTDSDEISKWLEKHQGKNVIVFTTYQSGEVAAESAKKSGYEFDVGILDEAHKTVGKVDALFSHLLHDENIKIKRRIFMTATERYYQGSSDDIASMDDLELYGDTFEYLSFKEAIESQPPILSDYKIITIFVKHSEIKDLIDRNSFVKPKGKWDEELEARAFTALIALRKAMQDYPIRHAISFHRSIEGARTFKENQDIFTKSFPEFEELDTFFVSGKTPTSERSREIEAFASSKRSLISNARCLSEGVDVPKIDCVLFADPRQSAVDIVQATGRALRKHDEKEFGYIIVPVLLEEDSLVSEQAFEAIITVVRALGANDERIIEYFRSVSEGRKLKDGLSPIDIRIADGVAIDSNKFIESIELNVWPRLAKLSWRPFEEAREFVRGLGLISVREWDLYRKGELKEKGTMPDNIPKAPSQVYKNDGWINWGDWLGTWRVADQHKHKQRRRFKEAREFVRSLGLTCVRDWRFYCKGKLNDKGQKPEDISANPNNTYKDEGWAGWRDWLGSSGVNRRRKGKPFIEAREFVHRLGLISVREWNLYCKGGLQEKGTIPDDIPTNPNKTYKNDGWIDWGDWLGTGTVAPSKKKCRSIGEARRFVQRLGLKGDNEWRRYCNGELADKGNKPDDIPANPNNVYKDEGWDSMGDWLGTGTVASYKKKWRSFGGAREFARRLKLRNADEWRRYSKGTLDGKGVKPDDIPRTPDRVYKNDGWIDWGDWLGKG